jgi:hypothetical protein
MVKTVKFEKQIRLEYCFDRLSSIKIIQIFEIFVPDKVWIPGNDGKDVTRSEGGSEHEACSRLRTSVLGRPKRETDY